ncbi:MAG: diguanylate cyclase [Synergistaceae bacterium]|nr:diguanylate cyclase [Synergistaceae bacterium]
MFEYLKNLIYSPSAAQLDISKLPEEFTNLGKGLVYYAECVSETTNLAKDLSKGELNGKMPSRGNEIASPLKGLQASLKHLTWQTQQVAKGDYKQHVSFMGEFADSFNTMIDQLAARRDALLHEIEINKKKSEALSQNNNLLEAITENISQWIVVISRNSCEWLYVNRDVSTVLTSPKTRPALRQWLCERIGEAPEGRTMQVVELELPGNGATQYFSVAIHPLHWYEHDAAAFVFTDVSDEKHQLRKLETVAYYDPLTKAFNRHYGMELLTKWLTGNIAFIICFVDLDNLKYVNDKFGHAEGDAYILSVVEILRMFSDDAIICRLGGDEFMLLSRSCGVSEAEARLEELRSIMTENNGKPGCLYNHSISYGVVQASENEQLSASALLGIADEKMYKYQREHTMQRGAPPAEPNEMERPAVGAE